MLAEGQDCSQKLKTKIMLILANSLFWNEKHGHFV